MMADLDATQALHLDDYLEETQALEEESITKSSKLPVSHLKVLNYKNIPETTFPIFEGDNFIGRDEHCNITISTKPVSKRHACIEVQDETHLIYDCNSRNKTKKNKMFLKPQVRYELQDKDQLMFADVNCNYLIGLPKIQDTDNQSETGSETGSESMMPESNEEIELALDDSSILKPSEEYEKKNLGGVSPVFLAETDDETDDEVGSSFVIDQTLLYSQTKSEETNNTDTTTSDTLPATVPTVHEIIPETPFQRHKYNEDETTTPLERAVDVKSDPFKRLSKGNTLDYGLKTLDESNCSRESEDFSIDDDVTKSLPGQSGLVKKSSDDDNEDYEQNKDTEPKPPTTPPRNATRDQPSDFMETLPYELCDVVPESPVTGDELPSGGKGIEMPVDDDLAATQAYAITGDGGDEDGDDDNTEDTAGDNVPGEQEGVKKAVDTGMDATQAYMAGGDDEETDDEAGTAGEMVVGEDEGIKMPVDVSMAATQAYMAGDDDGERDATGKMIIGENEGVKMPVDVSMVASQAYMAGGDDEEETDDERDTTEKMIIGKNEGVKMPVDVSMVASQAYMAGDDDEEPDDEQDTTGKMVMGENEGVKMPVGESMDATQAYVMFDDVGQDNDGVRTGGEDTADEMATQAYGLFIDTPEISESTGDELPTQAYGIGTYGIGDKRVSEEETGDELPTQAYGIGLKGERASEGETGDEFATQVYGTGIDNEDIPEERTGDELPALTEKEAGDNASASVDDEGTSTDKEIGKRKSGKRKIRGSKVTFAATSVSNEGDMKPVEQDVSSDSSELPSLASFGIAQTDQATLEREGESLRKAKPLSGKNKRQRTKVSSTVTKSPSVVIEGEMAFSGGKRCYVECTAENGANEMNEVIKEDEGILAGSKDDDIRSSTTGRGRGRGRKSGTRRGKNVEKEDSENLSEPKDDGVMLLTPVRGRGRSRKAGATRGEHVEKEDNEDISQPKEDSVSSSTPGRGRGRSRKSGTTRGKDVEKRDNEDLNEPKEDNVGSSTPERARGRSRKDGATRGKHVQTEDSEDLPEVKEDSVGSSTPRRGRGRSRKAGASRGKHVQTEDSEDLPEIKEDSIGSSTPRRGRGHSRKSGTTRGKRVDKEDKVGNNEDKLEHSGNKDDELKEDEDGKDLAGSTRTTRTMNRVQRGKAGRKEKQENNQELQENTEDMEVVGLLGFQGDQEGETVVTTKEDMEDADDFDDVKEKLRKGKRTGSNLSVKDNEGTEDKDEVQEKKGRRQRGKRREVKESIEEEEEVKGMKKKRTRKSKITDTNEKKVEEDEKKNESIEKKVEEKEDPFKFDDDEDDDIVRPSKRGSAGKRASSRTPPSTPTPVKKTGAKLAPRGRRGKQTTPTKESEFVAPAEVTVNVSQRSRRSSTSSETSSQGTAQKRRRGRKSEQESLSSPGPSTESTGTPSKRTKLDSESTSDVKIMFTGLTQEDQARKIVQDLHGGVVESVYECSHLVTDKVRRTVKLLCAVSRGIPVVDKKWLQACKKAKSFIDCSKFIMRDKPSEKQYDFSMERSLESSKQHGLLEGYQVHVTPHVVPKPELMKEIIHCSKGEYLPAFPTSFSDQVIVISCEEDQKLCQKAQGFVHSSELLLTGVLRQQLDLKQYQITQEKYATPTKKTSRRR